MVYILLSYIENTDIHLQRNKALFPQTTKIKMTVNEIYKPYYYNCSVGTQLGGLHPPPNRQGGRLGCVGVYIYRHSRKARHSVGT